MEAEQPNWKPKFAHCLPLGLLGLPYIQSKQGTHASRRLATHCTFWVVPGTQWAGWDAPQRHLMHLCTHFDTFEKAWVILSVSTYCNNLVLGSTQPKQFKQCPHSRTTTLAVSSVHTRVQITYSVCSLRWKWASDAAIGFVMTRETSSPAS